MPQKDVGYLIKNIHDKLKAKADAALTRYGLTYAQSRVFAFLNSRDGQATQKEIELFLNVAHPTVVGIVSRMQQNGYVTCWQDEDRRNKNVKLTQKAEAIGIDMEQHILETEKDLLSPLSVEDAARLKEMLSAICDHLERG